MLDYIIIGMILNKSLTGYDIKKHIEDGIGIFYKASYGSIYPALKRLTDKSFLTMTEKPYGDRQKKYYIATEKGENAFLDWLSSPMNLNDGADSHLVKVYFFDKLPVDIRDRQLKEYEIRNINYLQKLQSLENNFNKMEDKDCFYFKLSTLYYGICIVQENIRWCKHLQSKKPLSELLKENI